MFSINRNLKALSRLHLVLALILVSGLLFPTGALAADTWNMYQHDARHTGKSSNKAPEQPSVLWVVPFGGTGKPSTPVIATEDGKAYVGVEVTPKDESTATTTTNATAASNDGHSGVFAFGEDNKVIWVSEVKGKISGPLAVGKDGTVYAAINTILVALNKKNGSAKWQLPLNGISTGGITLGSDDTVYIATLQGKSLYAVTSYGKLKWMYTAAGQIGSSPVIGSDGTVYFTAQDNCLYAVASNGSLKWKYAVKEDRKLTLSSPALGKSNTVYFGVTKDGGDIVAEDETKLANGLLYAVGPDGKLKWKYQAMTKRIQMPAITEEETVVVAGTSLNYTVDRSLTMGECFIYAVGAGGKEVWKYDAMDNAIEGETVIDGKGDIYFSSSEGHLTCISKNGVMKWRAKVGGKVTIGPKGVLYVAAKGSVGAITEKDIAATQKNSEEINKETKGKSSGSSVFSFMIYIIPVIVAVGIGLFFKTKLAEKPDDGGGTGNTSS